MTHEQRWKALRKWVEANGHSCSCDDYCLCGQQLDKDDVRAEMDRLDRLSRQRPRKGKQR